VITKTGRKSNL